MLWSEMLLKTLRRKRAERSFLDFWMRIFYLRPAEA